MFELFTDLNKLRPLLSRRDKKKFIILLGLMFLGAILEAVGVGAIPLFVSTVTNPSSFSENEWVGEWFSNLPDEPTTDLLLWISILLIGFIVLKNLFLTFVFYVQARIVTTQQLMLGDRMFRIYLSAPYEWHLKRSSSELLRNIQTDTAQILKGVLMPFLDLVMSLVMIGAILAVTVLNMPGVALVSFVTMGAGLYLVIRVFQKRLRQVGQVIWKEQGEIIKAIQQGFGALIDSRILDCSGYLSKIHRTSLKRQMKAQRQQITIQKSTPYAVETLAIFGLLSILLFLLHTQENSSDVLPLIALLGVATIRLKQLTTKVAAAINQMNAARAYIPTILNDVHELGSIEKLQREKTRKVKSKGGFEVLRLESVSYTYPDVESPTVKSVSLELNRGESIAFVGSTGCGKSTLVNLILGLLEPSSGSITYNGINIFENIDGWRAHLGYIPQSIYLIDDTIRANVAFGVPHNEIDNERLRVALHSAHLDEFINTLPDGLDTIIGERGVRLSGGQRQRLGIARAIYPDPEVLIMDEATSALDNKTEEEVMQAIHNLKHDRTLIMIAHRLSTVEDCDRLYFLNDGSIENIGTYSEMKKSSMTFREMAAETTVSLK